MNWSKAEIAIAKSSSDGTMPDALEAIGVIKDKTTTLEASEGEELKATATGGIVVASEKQEGGYSLKTRVINPSDELYERLGLGKVNSGELDVVTHVVADNYAVRVTPKSIGATGIKAPLTNVSFLPGHSEDEGSYVDITFNILPILDDNFNVSMWYTRFKKKPLPVCTPSALSFPKEADTTGKVIAVSGLTGAVTVSADQSWATPTVAGQSVTVKVTANTGAARTANVSITVNGSTNKILVSQAGV